MLIAHVSTLHPRTDPRIFEKESRAAAERYPGQVELVCADGLGDSDDGSLRIVDLGNLPASRSGRMLVGSRRVWNHVRRTRPSLVHFHDPELIPVCLALRLGGTRSIYDVHEDMTLQIRSKSWIPRPLRAPVAVLVGLLERFSSTRFIGVVAATPTIAMRFQTADTITVCNFPEPERFVPAERPIEERVREFGYFGGISEMRGAMTMYRALDRVNQTESVRLHLAGRYVPVTLEERLLNHPAAAYVEYHGYLSREDVATLTARIGCGLVVLEPRPNYLDALPTKLFEYMSAGLPVIASDFPLWRQIVEDADCGVLVDPLDPEALAEAMLNMIDNPAEAARLGGNGRIASARYSWTSEKHRLLDAYEGWLNRVTT